MDKAVSNQSACIPQLWNLVVTACIIITRGVETWKTGDPILSFIRGPYPLKQCHTVQSLLQRLPPHHEKACMWTVKWVEGSVWLYGTPNFVNMILRAIFHHEFYGGKVVDFWRVGSDMKNSSGNISTFKIFFLKKNCFTFLLHFSNAQ